MRGGRGDSDDNRAELYGTIFGIAVGGCWGLVGCCRVEGRSVIWGIERLARIHS